MRCVGKISQWQYGQVRLVVVCGAVQGQWGVGHRGVGCRCGRHYATMGVSGVWGSAALGCGAVGCGVQGAVWGQWSVGCERGELVWAALWALSWVGPCGFVGAVGGPGRASVG